MKQRYNRIFMLEDKLYAPGAPLLIEAGTLVEDPRDGRLLAALRLRSLTSRTITAVTAVITPLDGAGNPMEPAEEYTCEGLELRRGQSFTFHPPEAVPPGAVRFRATVFLVTFSGEDVWLDPESRWDPLPAAQGLGTLPADPDLAEELRSYYGKDYRNPPGVWEDLWMCSCGAANRMEETVCQKCGRARVLTDEAGLEFLKSRRQERLETARQDRKALLRRLRLIAAAAAAAVVLAAAVGLFTRWMLRRHEARQALQRTYDEAMLLLDAGAYETAIDQLESLGDYADSPQQLQRAIEARDVHDREAAYAYGKMLMDDGDLVGAAEQFSALGDYADAEDYQLSHSSLLVRERVLSGEEDRTTAYVYDDAGRRSSGYASAYPASITTYEYADGVLYSSHTRTDQGQGAYEVEDVIYNLRGDPEHRTITSFYPGGGPGGVRQTYDCVYSYRDDGLPEELWVYCQGVLYWRWYSYEYQLDAQGRPVTRTTALHDPDTGDVTGYLDTGYEYDELGNLLTETTWDRDTGLELQRREYTYETSYALEKDQKPAAP